MAITGAWSARAVQAEGYTGAQRWGTGVNKVHAIRDHGHEPGKVIQSGATGQNPPPDQLLGAYAWGYTMDDVASMYHGEDYRYLQEDHPNWGDDAPGRADRTGAIMEEGTYPQPEGWPSWGPHFDDNPVDGFPIGGPPGGADVRSHTDGLDVERRRAIAVPSGGVSGGWLNKTRAAQNEAVVSDPSQYEVQTSMRQVHQTSSNTGAVIRRTDDPRTGITTRTAGTKVKSYGKSWGMGGGPGAPDMYPYDQNLMYRPFFYRSAGLPPAEHHDWNEVTYFEPRQRTVPEDPYPGYQSGASQAGDPSFGYTSEDMPWL